MALCDHTTPRCMVGTWEEGGWHMGLANTFTSSGSSEHWHFCMEQFFSDTITADPPWRSSLKRKWHQHLKNDSYFYFRCCFVWYCFKPWSRFLSCLIPAIRKCYAELPERVTEIHTMNLAIQNSLIGRTGARLCQCL